MSDLEGTAKPILTPMIIGQRVTLSDESRRSFRPGPLGTTATAERAEPVLPDPWSYAAQRYTAEPV
jgi:hypothetical protein